MQGNADSNRRSKACLPEIWDLWLPAINTHGGFGRWGYAELTDPKAFRVGLSEAIEALYLEPSEFAREGAAR